VEIGGMRIQSGNRRHEDQAGDRRHEDQTGDRRHEDPEWKQKVRG
jgi:hypothetical protein